MVERALEERKQVALAYLAACRGDVGKAARKAKCKPVQLRQWAEEEAGGGAPEVPAAEEKPLTARQQRFVWEYLVDCNGAQAAIRAGYSARRAKEQAAWLVANRNVQRALREAIAKQQERTEITADMVVREIAALAFGDLRDVAEWDEDGVALKASGNLSDAAAKLVAEVQQTSNENGVNVRVKLHDKLGALRDLGRRFGIFVDRQEHTGPAGGPIEYIEIARLPAREEPAE